MDQLANVEFTPEQLSAFVGGRIPLDSELSELMYKNWESDPNGPVARYVDETTRLLDRAFSVDLAALLLGAIKAKSSDFGAISNDGGEVLVATAVRPLEAKSPPTEPSTARPLVQSNPAGSFRTNVIALLWWLIATPLVACICTMWAFVFDSSNSDVFNLSRNLLPIGVATIIIILAGLIRDIHRVVAGRQASGLSLFDSVIGAAFGLLIGWIASIPLLIGCVVLSAVSLLNLSMILPVVEFVIGLTVTIFVGSVVVCSHRGLVLGANEHRLHDGQITTRWEVSCRFALLLLSASAVFLYDLLTGNYWNATSTVFQMIDGTIVGASDFWFQNGAYLGAALGILSLSLVRAARDERIRNVDLKRVSARLMFTTSVGGLIFVAMLGTGGNPWISFFWLITIASSALSLSLIEKDLSVPDRMFGVLFCVQFIFWGLIIVFAISELPFHRAIFRIGVLLETMIGGFTFAGRPAWKAWKRWRLRNGK